MIKIAHRGNISGPNLEMENEPGYLMDAIEAGYDVEVDVWVMDDVICFGHDYPKHCAIPESFLLEIGHAAWFHCKDLGALDFFNKTFPHLNYFWHQEDNYTLTSQGYIWAYPGMPVTGRTILVDIDNSSDQTAHGICSDYWK